MTHRELIDLCLEMPQSYEDYPFDETTPVIRHEANKMFITNSPRSGECGYDGELDVWKFDPSKPFPQPQKPKAKRGSAWMPPEENEVSAEAKWNTIGAAFQKKLLNNVFCSKCGVTTIVDYTIEKSRSDIVLQGKCEKCNGKVARVVEFD